MKKLLLLLVSLFLITGCSLDSKKESVVDVDFSSYNGKFKVTASSYWDAVEDKGELNDSADLEIADRKNQKYFIALMESKEDISWAYKEYSDYILEQNATLYEVKFDEIKTTNINGYDVNYVEFKTQPSGVNIYMSIYVIETKNYYGQILIWTKYSQKEEVQDEFTKMVSSFKEIEEVEKDNEQIKE